MSGGILYVGAGNPWVGGAGHLVRQWMFLRALAELDRLELVLFGPEPDGDRACPLPHARLQRFELPAIRPESPLARGTGDLLSPEPRRVRVRDCAATRAAVRRLNPGRFDAVFAYRIDFAHWAGVLHHPRLLLDVDDPEHVRAARRAAAAGERLDWRTARDLRKLRRFEHAAVRQARAAFVCQPHDQAAFAPLRPLVVPNCVRVPPRRAPRTAPAARILYLGNFAGGAESANVDGLHWLLDTIWPKLHAAAPQAELVLAGPMDDDTRRFVGARPGVRVPGFVADLGAAFAEAALSIAPLRFGTGTRIKILESLAHGCPVATTTLGCEGLAVAHEREVLIADEPAAFRSACLRLLGDAALREQLSAAGYALVCGQYDLERRHAGLVALLQRLVEQVSPGPAGARLAPA